MGSLQSVIKALDVEKVVWIDDMFAPTAAVDTTDLVALAKAMVDENVFVKLGLADLSEDDVEVDNLVLRLEENPELAGRAKELVRTTSYLERARTWLREMKCKTEEKSGADWQQILKDKLYTYEKTLFLLDRDFGREQITKDASDRMLKETIDGHILTNSTNYCVVFSQEVNADREVETRNYLAAQLLEAKPEQQDLIRFSVVAKNLSGQANESDLSKSLRDKLAGVVLYSMLNSVEASLKRSVTSIKNLLATSFSDVNKSVLRNSYDEGASEIEVLMRILGQKHRIELAKDLGSAQDGGLSETLKRFRMFQLDSYEDGPPHEVSGELKQICRAEAISEGALVNKLFLPIVPGDIFETVEARRGTEDIAATWTDDLIVNQEYWMLLGQLCDILPRSDGNPKSNMAFLAKFKTVGKKYKPISSQVQSGRAALVMVADLGMAFDFQKVISANVLALQLCSFNKYGMASLSDIDVSHDVWSLASLAKAMSNALGLFKQKPFPERLERYAIAFDGNDDNRKVKIDEAQDIRTFSYPIRRVCRVRDIEAADALAALERYWRRQPRPHEFG
jgi:hypothetical protein